MLDTPRKLSRATRLALVAGLWMVMLVIVLLAVRNMGWVESWAGGTLFTCIFLYALLLAFSFVAAAIHLSIDVIQGRYPYPQQVDKRAKKEMVMPVSGETSVASRPATRHRPWYKATLNVLGVAAVTLTLTLVMLEVGLRLFAPQSSPEMQAQLWSTMFVGDSQTVYRNRPDIKVIFRLEGTPTNWFVNSQGLREDHTVGSPLTDTLRILDIGDSFTFGYGVEENQAFTSLLNGGGGGKRIESINAGVSGYGTDNEAAWLHVYGWSYQPNIVLVGFFVGNDVSDVLVNTNHIRVDAAGSLAITPWEGPPAWEISTPVPANPVAQSKAWLAANSHAYVFLRAAYNGLIDQFKKPEVRSVVRTDTARMYYKNTPADIEDGWGRVTALLDYMNKETTAHGAKLVVAVIPTREQVEDVYWNDMKAGFGLTEDSLERDKPQRLLAEWSATSGVPLINLLPGFRAAQGGPYYFRKDPHWNAAGQSLAATLIKEGLLKLGLIGK